MTEVQLGEIIRRARLLALAAADDLHPGRNDNAAAAYDALDALEKAVKLLKEAGFTTND